MGTRGRIYAFTSILTFLVAVPLEAVTVNPALCPTNKIAPHRRRILNADYARPRTLGAFYDLLAPNSLQFQNDAPIDDLQENPQEDDPDDCGEIEDYDENDLSSLSQGQRRDGIGIRDDRTYFPFNRPPQYYPMRPPSTIRPQRPPIHNYPPTRPPFWSGGFFGTNGYRPPLQQYPSDDIKPIHESSGDFQMPYHPSLVGGPSGHIIGVSPARPTTDDFDTTTARPFFPNRTPRYDPEPTSSRPYYPNRIRPSTPSPNDMYSRRPRPRNMSNSGIFGSFVDLLFK